MVRFLEKNEYETTRELFIRCFGNDEEFMEEYYGGVIYDGLTAVLELDCEPSHGIGLADPKPDRETSSGIAAMVQVLFKDVVVGNPVSGKRIKIPYIMGVCTAPEYRHRGFMDQVMELVIRRLEKDGYPFCFLIAVDRNIYRHLGFVYDQLLSPEECEALYADDGLDTCSVRLLNTEEVPEFSVVT